MNEEKGDRMNNIKIEEYPHSNRARGVFRYNSRAIEQIKKVCRIRYTYP